MFEMVRAKPLTTPEHTRADETRRGEGIDRSTIRQRLALTPAERVTLVVREANNLAKFLSAIRR